MCLGGGGGCVGEVLRPIKAMSSRSVNLSTLFLGSLPKR